MLCVSIRSPSGGCNKDLVSFLFLTMWHGVLIPCVCSYIYLFFAHSLITSFFYKLHCLAPFMHSWPIAVTRICTNQNVCTRGSILGQKSPRLGLFFLAVLKLQSLQLFLCLCRKGKLLLPSRVSLCSMKCLTSLE